MSRPTTPKRRRSHRSSGVFNILSQSPKIHYPIDPENLPLESQTNTEKFEKLSDSMEELEMNMTGLQQIHESLCGEFNESFAGFLYGLSMTMWCVHFPGKPSRDQWEKVKLIEGLDERIDELKRKLKVSKEENENLKKRLNTRPNASSARSKRATFAEDDTNESFVLNPSTSSSKVSKIPVRGDRRDNAASGKVGLNAAVGPNLNQPPRYMRGLFDSTNTRTQRSRPDVTRRTAGRDSRVFR
ncbi:DASH complex subunit Dam1p [[Candida] railenensis]|uniref:DASH complex subunit DAM1 n=1 Tax=[Candida] railenensis TaxID=45579 RepID=A0A9P0QLM8_9ASCO|nr:DASH complex subunit Dam1p [[Candida] railenensis]